MLDAFFFAGHRAIMANAVLGTSRLIRVQENAGRTHTHTHWFQKPPLLCLLLARHADREGGVVSRAGEPFLLQSPLLSPSGMTCMHVADFHANMISFLFLVQTKQNARAYLL